MNLGTKQAQQMLENAFLNIQRLEPDCTDEKYRWEEYKKRYLHGRTDCYTQYDFNCMVGVNWHIWVRKLREEERNKLINEHEPTHFICRCCGKIKPKEEVKNFLYENIEGDFGSVDIKIDALKCIECYEQEQTAKKEISKALRKEYMKEYQQQWYQDHKEEIAARQKANRAARNASNKKYAQTHREQINQHIAERKQTDPVYKLKCQARKTIYSSFTRAGYVKQEKCESIVGLKQDAFIEYLLKTYEKNYGKSWDGEEPVHVDHIIPLATANTEEDVIRLCHYTNLQLLTASDNIKKGDKLYANH